MRLVESSIRVPICVDLDGTLITSDTLLKSTRKFVGMSPLNIFRLLSWRLHGMAVLKRRVVGRVTLDPASLTYHPAFLAYLREAHSQGRQLVLSTGADERVASPVAAYLGIFSGVLASNGSQNLKGSKKAKALILRFGLRGFDYAGDSWADLAVWRAARAAIVVNASPWTVAALRLLGVEVTRSFTKAARPV